MLMSNAENCETIETDDEPSGESPDRFDSEFSTTTGTGLEVCTSTFSSLSAEVLGSGVGISDTGAGSGETAAVVGVG